MGDCFYPWQTPSGWSLTLADGQCLNVPGCGLLVGRGSGCDVVLDDPDVSRRHVLFTMLAGNPWAIDQGSSNGTLVDGLPLQRRRLGNVHEILLGSSLIGWEAGEVGEFVLPSRLQEDWAAWQECLRRKRFAKDGLEILCRLAAAESARIGPHGGLALSWRDPMGSESLGPLRRQVLAEALKQAPA